ncbi:glycosyltransferase [Rhodobacteraceae bacterium M382]|nr:glycosyltransferase [Rhodobacteraceae bacterium M382]
MKVMIAVTHLLGTGHLSRALTLGRAFAQQGHHVVLASGGFPVSQLKTDGIEFVQLPALRSDGVNFTRLLTPTGSCADTTYLGSRADALRQTLVTLQPDILITELYPFGRRVLAAEFLSLLQAAHQLPIRPVILSSIRDILAPPSKPKKAVAADEVIANWYDAVLVHSDPTTTTLDVSWPVSPLLATKLRYTGFVAPPPPSPHPQQVGKGEVLVSAGGGSVGDALYETAMIAARTDTETTWHLLVGGTEAKTRIDRFRTIESPAVLDTARPDFRQMLCHASALVGMCGYNTTMDLLQTGVPSVLIPFDAGSEVEQTLRSTSLARMRGIEVIPSANLTPQTLGAAVNRVRAALARKSDTIAFDGADNTVDIACKMAQERP